MSIQGSGENTPDISAKGSTGGAWDFSVNRRFLQRSVVTVLVLVIAFQLVSWAFGKSKDFLFLLLIAWLLGIAITPLVEFLTKRGMRRGLSTFLTLLGLVLLSVGFIAAFGQLLASQLASLIFQIPTLVEGFIGWLNASFNLGIDPVSIEQSLNISNLLFK